ncbi:Plant specific Rop nucleotide exchanger, PRONE [Cynara cardunculus var. scolymus]|uniref:Plant specific Rop nucleotide exchanger, PRONE n=1 Tax=Cynara cardunculus var. scolymus TaxID=59895 RepID=A0A118K2Z8_CYNCS|nr:Plant specific Rop nucleotide exchanger, PRONE [Cynara cardunculus var. scolymus]
MEILSSDDESDHQSHRFEDYSLSADVSESESCGASSFDSPVASTSRSTPPLVGPHFNSYLPVPSPIKPPPLAGGNYTGKAQTENLTEAQLMKDRFSKLLLGEDMSGRGNGVCTALAISNTITRLSATVFGDLWKLEPLSPESKSMWRKEMEWVLSVSDSIVELTPSFQEFPNGGTFEVMVTRPRSDLYVNLPPLRKLDAMLVSMLDGFHESEFCYVDRGLVASDRDRNVERVSDSPLIQYEEKWWLPFPKVPAKGLAETTVRRLQQCRDCGNQIFKAAASINGHVLSQMESAKACLGETLHHYITTAQFSPESLLDYLEMSSECTTLQIANRIEAAMHIWTQKSSKPHGTRKLLWSGNGSEKEKRQAILESYSRVIESLAFNLMARIDDLLYVDDATKKRAAAEAGFAASLHAQRPTLHGYSSSSMVAAGTAMNRWPSTVRSLDKRRFSYSSTSNIDSLEEALERLTFN